MVARTISPALLIAGRFFLTMARKPVKINVRVVNVDFPRYQIVDNRHRYWTGTGWSKEVSKALLYAHAGIMWPDVLALRETAGLHGSDAPDGEIS